MGTYRFALFNLSHHFNKLSLSNNSNCVKRCLSDHDLLQNHIQPSYTSWRLSQSFFSRLPAEKLWKGVISVSPAGRKKGRGKGRNKKLAQDLNRGQVIGFGKINMLWPGLNAPIIRGREFLRQQELPPDEDREKRLIEVRKTLRPYGRDKRVHPLERGWSGTKLHGRSLGPPDPVGDENFEGFVSKCLEFDVVSHMERQGRVRSLRAFVVVGNQNGLGGFAVAKSQNGASATKAALNKAAKVLRFVKRDNNTVIHDFVSEFGPVKLFVERRPEGFGLVCHRAIKAICEVIGIKDIYVKAEGSVGNVKCVTRAFFIGLHKQKSLKDIANEKGLHIVKLAKSRGNSPQVVASPDKCRTEEEIGITEFCDFNLHIHDGKVVEPRKKYEPFYHKFDSYKKEMKDREKLRNHRKVHIHLLSKYDALKSFVQVRLEEEAKQKLKETVEEES